MLEVSYVRQGVLKVRESDIMGPIATALLYSVCGLLSLVAAAFCVFTVYLYYIQYKYSHIPSPKNKSFFLGHLADNIQMMKETGNPELPLPVLLTKWQKDSNSSIFVIRFLHKNMVVLTDPDMIKEVAMQSKHPKAHSLMQKFQYLFGERFMGHGILSISDYEVWKPRRSLYDPAFRKSYLEGILPSFNSCVDRFLEKLRPLADGVTSVPMKQHLAEATLDIIGQVAFGSDFIKDWDPQSLGLKKDTKLTYLISNSFSGLQKSLQFPFYRLLHPFETQGYRETARVLRVVGRDCIKKRIELVESGAQVPNDILTHILKVAATQTIVDIEELVDDFVTYYIAGQETTSNLLSFTVALVYQHPQVLERLQTEVEEVLGNETTVTKEHLQKLQYTEQVLMEALRLYPPVPALGKQAPPGGLTVGGYLIPGGTLLTLSPGPTCRMPEYFDDPDTFNPDRFNPENPQPSSFVYFPFGVGHRSCIGKHFAMMEAKMILARLLQTYQLTLPSDYQLVAVQRATTQPRDNVNCTIQLRHH